VLGRWLSRLHRGVVDLVVDVGDVDDQLGVEALVSEEAPEQGEDHEGPGVADVDPAVDGRPAGVDPDLAGLAGFQVAVLAAQRVADPDGRHGADRIRARNTQIGALGHDVASRPGSCFTPGDLPVYITGFAPSIDPGRR